MSEEIKLSKTVQDRIQNLSERTKISIKDLEEEYKLRYLEVCKKFSGDQQIDNEGARERHALMGLWRDYITRPPVDPYFAVPLGFGGVRKASSGNMTATLFALIKGEDGIQRINCQGTAAEKIIKTVSLFDGYDVKLGKYKNGGFSADDRSRFESPRRFSKSPEDILKPLKIPSTTIKDASTNISRVRSDGFVESTDWKRVRGMVSRKWARERKEQEVDKDGKVTQEYQEALATYTITDDSIWYDEPVLVGSGENKTVQAPGFTCWIAPELQIYEVDDECDFIGPISYYKKGNEFQMNCYLVLPVHTVSGSPDREGE